MTSEIRANTLKNRVGLGTVSFTNTGPVVSGIVTATSIEVVGAIGDNAGRIKLPDGMTGSPYTGNLELGNSRDFVMVHDAHHTYIMNNTGDLYMGNSAGNFPVHVKGNNAVEVRYASALVLQTTSSGVSFLKDIDVDGHTNLDNVSIAGVTSVASLSSGRVVLAGTNGKLEDTANLTFSGSTLTAGGFYVNGSQNASLTNNQLIFDRAGYSYIDQTSNSGSLAFRVSASNTVALRLDSNAQSIFGASGTHIINYGGSATPHNNNCGALLSSNNIGLIGQYSTLNQPFDHSTATTSGNWWMLGRSTGTTNEWGLNVRSGGGNNNLNVWKVVGDSNGHVTYQSFHTSNAQERLRITSDGQITTRGATSTGFNNIGTNAFGCFFTIYGGHTINECGVLSLEGNTNTGGQPLGHIQFINRANANGSSGGNVQARLGAKIVSYAETTDSNAGDDSGAVLSFTTKKEATAPSEKLRIFGDGRIGIGDGGMNGCKASIGGLDVSSGIYSIIMGGETNVGDGTGRRNSYQKESRLGMPHYTNAEEPFGLVYGVTISGENRLNLGGGSGIVNAATRLSLYTATNTTTTAGTEQIRMTGEGVWRVGKVTAIAEGNPTEMPRVSSSRGYTSIGRDGASSIIRRMGAYRGSVSGMKLFSVGSNGPQTWARVVIGTILGTPSFQACYQEFLYSGNKSLIDSRYRGSNHTGVVTLAWSGNELQYSCNNGNYYSTIEVELGAPNDTTSNGWYPTWGTSW